LVQIGRGLDALRHAPKRNCLAVPRAAATVKRIRFEAPRLKTCGILVRGEWISWTQDLVFDPRRAPPEAKFEVILDHVRKQLFLLDKIVAFCLS
jgi:hypothetical protein